MSINKHEELAGRASRQHTLLAPALLRPNNPLECGVVTGPVEAGHHRAPGLVILWHCYSTAGRGGWVVSS